MDKRKKVLVTGANGFTGSTPVKILQDSNWKKRRKGTGKKKSRLYEEAHAILEMLFSKRFLLAEGRDASKSPKM